MVLMNTIFSRIFFFLEKFRSNLALKHSVLEEDGGRTEGSLLKSKVHKSLQKYFRLGRCFAEENV